MESARWPRTFAPDNWDIEQRWMPPMATGVRLASSCSNASWSSSGCKTHRWNLLSCHRSYTRPREGQPTRGKLGSKSLRWLGHCPVRSAREASNSAGRSKGEPQAPKFEPHGKRMVRVYGSAEPVLLSAKARAKGEELGKGSRWTPRGRRGRHVEKEPQRKHGTSRGSLSRSVKLGRGGTDDELAKPLNVIQRV